MSTLNDELARLEREYKAAKEKLEKTMALSAMIPEDEKDVAEKMHTALCHSNHTDGCDWLYDDGSWTIYSRRLYLDKARLLLKIIPKTKIFQVVDVLARL